MHDVKGARGLFCTIHMFYARIGSGYSKIARPRQPSTLSIRGSCVGYSAAKVLLLRPGLLLPFALSPLSVLQASIAPPRRTLRPIASIHHVPQLPYEQVAIVTTLVLWRWTLCTPASSSNRPACLCPATILQRRRGTAPCNAPIFHACAALLSSAELPSQ